MKAIFEYLSVILIMAGSLQGCCSGNPQPNPYLNTDWAQDTLWDDGQAEMALYDARRTVYGTSREFEYMFILVKEDFNKEYRVKTDNYDRDDLYPVMKVNKSCRIETQNYPYHYLTSLFYRRENPQTVHKLTHTAQEWCGNTAKSFVEKGASYLFDFMSYFDGQGNGRTKIRKGPWFEDQLSYTLRTLKFEEDLAFDIDLYPSQVTNHARIPEAMAAQVAISRPATGELSGVPADLIEQPWKVVVSKPDEEKLIYWLNGCYPNQLLRMESSDGQSLTLKKTYRDAYWKHD